MPNVTMTARLNLPLLAAGQAQKEMTHNEALTLVDALIVPVVEEVGRVSPPSSPALGQCWALGANPTGEWVGQPFALAVATTGGWRFAPLPIGATVILAANLLIYRRNTGGWQVPQTVGAPTGGAVVDAQCRTAVANVISALLAAGIAAP